MGLMRWDSKLQQGFPVDEGAGQSLASFLGESEWIEESERQRWCGRYEHADLWFDENRVRHDGGAKKCALCGAKRRGA